MHPPAPGQSPWATARRLLAVALPVYFVWEVLQTPAFTGQPSEWWAAIAICGLATLGDGVAVVFLWAAAALAFGDATWFRPPAPGRYAVVVLGGVVVQILVEWVLAGRLGLWGYQPSHPVVLGVGLLPLVQPVVLLPITFGALAWWDRRPP